jgi:hypothetical protein
MTIMVQTLEIFHQKTTTNRITNKIEVTTIIMIIMTLKENKILKIITKLRENFNQDKMITKEMTFTNLTRISEEEVEEWEVEELVVPVKVEETKVHTEVEMEEEEEEGTILTIHNQEAIHQIQKEFTKKKMKIHTKVSLLTLTLKRNSLPT